MKTKIQVLKYRFMRKTLFVYAVLLLISFQTFSQANDRLMWTVRILSNKLGMPWEVTYGPDDSLWVTEAKAYRIRKISTINGGKRTILSLANNKNFGRSSPTWPQGGLMGLVLHPQLMSGKPYVYVAYVYRFDSCTTTMTRNPCYFKSKIERYTYNIGPNTLTNPVTVMDNIPGSNDHNSGRLAIGPDLKLYYTVGDMGAGQFGNQSRTENAQNKDIYEGKILRLNLEQDTDAPDVTDPFNRWIPNDNPYTNSVTGKMTAVYTYGHRNAQGLVWGHINLGDSLFSSEHGPQSDDEVNIITRGKNYGHPYVMGYCDGNFNGISNGPYTPSASNGEQNNCATYNLYGSQPIKTLFSTNAPNPDPESNNATWPTVGPSSIDFYESNVLPGWQNSLLVTTLKNGRVIRLKLNANGNGVAADNGMNGTDTITYFNSSNGQSRYRDLCISPDGLKIYVATDSSGSTSGPTTGVTSLPNNPGCILEFSYSGVLSLRDMPASPKYDIRAEMKVYPNPATSSLNILVKRGVSKPMRVQLFDIAGKMIYQEFSNKDNFSIDVSDYIRGVYLLKIYNGSDVPVLLEKVIFK